MPVRVEKCLGTLEVSDSPCYADSLHCAFQLHRIGKRLPIALVVGHVLEILIFHVIRQLAATDGDPL